MYWLVYCYVVTSTRRKNAGSFGASRWQIPAVKTRRAVTLTAHLGGGERRGLAGVVHDGRAVGEPDEHEGAAADAAGGRADHAEAQRGGHGRVHGAAAVAERVAAGPQAPPIVHGHGAAMPVVRGHGGAAAVAATSLSLSYLLIVAYL